MFKKLGQKRQRFEAAMKNLRGILNQRQRGFESKIRIQQKRMGQNPF